MPNLLLTDSDLETSISDVAWPTTPGGKSADKKVGYKNNSDSAIENVEAAQWPAPVSNQAVGTIIKSMKVIPMNVSGDKAVTSHVKEDAEAVATLLELRDKVLRHDGSSWYTYDTGNVTFMGATGDTLYLLFNDITRKVIMEFLQAGSYTGVTFQIWSGSAWTALPTGWSDGTNGLSQDGELDLGPVDETNWAKTTIHGFNAYPLKITCTGIITQAIADVLYYGYCFELSKCFILGTPTAYYRKQAGPAYVLASDADIELSNKGRFIYHTNPLSAGEELAIEYSAKNPQPADYEITLHYFDSETWEAETGYLEGEYAEPTVLNGLAYECTTPGTSGTEEPAWPEEAGETVEDGTVVWTCREGTGSIPYCKVNRGPVIPVLLDGSYKHYNVVSGMEIVFMDNLNILSTGIIPISEMLKYLWQAADDGGEADTYYNQDAVISDSLDSGDVAPLYLSVRPPMDITFDENERYFRFYGWGDLN